MTEKERQRHIVNLRKMLDLLTHRAYLLVPIMNFYEDEWCLAGVTPLYATGGTVRRLYMLENNIPLSDLDMEQMYLSDIDIHSNIFENARGEVFNSYGLHDTTISNIFKNVKFEYPDMKVQFIRTSFQSSETNYIRNNITSSVILNFDIDCCRFIYCDGKIYDMRKHVEDNFFKTIVKFENLKALLRLDKYESYGFEFSRSQIIGALSEYNEDIEDCGWFYSQSVSYETSLNEPEEAE